MNLGIRSSCHADVGYKAAPIGVSSHLNPLACSLAASRGFKKDPQNGLLVVTPFLYRTHIGYSLYPKLGRLHESPHESYRATAVKP